MMMQASLWKDVSIQALYSLNENKLRAVLSILSVSLGIAAVMAVGSASESFKRYVFTELESYGLKSVWIYRDWNDVDPNKTQRQGSGISSEDFRNIQRGCCNLVYRATPWVYVEEKTSVNVGSVFVDSRVEGVGVDYVPINNEVLTSGRNFRPEEIARRKTVALIAPDVGEKLFGKGRPALGKSFRLFNQKFTIIGTLNSKHRELLAKLGQDTYEVNERILIPYTIYQSVLGSKDIHTIQAEAVSMAETFNAVDQLEALLNRTYSGRYKYTKETMDTWISNAESVRHWITAGGMAVAAVILLVGGMAVMTIMSTAVMERTREIGIRKAIGAQYTDVLFQFLLESIYITLIGGLIGLLLGVVALYVASWFTGYSISVSWYMAVIALLVSVFVGVLSGYYPAHRAALLKPVDALRYE